MNALPDYQNLDQSGESGQAAARMEARAREAASQELFAQLVVPLLLPAPRMVLEVGCGTAALARRLARFAPQAMVYASDKSSGMLAAAREIAETTPLVNLHLVRWDVLDEASFPFPVPQFDLILSSVLVPYLDDPQTAALVRRLAGRLAPGGVLAFIEQDHISDSLNYPRFELFRKVLNKDGRSLKPTLALGLRPLLRAAGLSLLPRRSFLWTDETYGPYTRDLLERFADSAFDQGRLTQSERDEWKRTLNELAAGGDFYYGIVYHLVAGRKE